MSAPAILSRAIRPAALPLLAALAACSGAEAAAPEAGPVLTVANGGASNPTAALDPRTGRGYVAWIGDDPASEGGVSNVYLAVHERGAATPAPAVRVNDIPGDAAPHEQAPAQVEVAPDGRVYVLWQNNTRVEGRRYPASDLRLAVSEDGGRTFRPAVTVNDDAGGPPSSHTFHDLDVAPDGTLYVSWIDSRVRDGLRAARPHGAHGGSGHGGHGGDDGLPGPEIRVSRSTDGGRSFQPSVVVDSGSCPCCRTSLATGPDGSVYVAWRKVFPGEVRDVVVARAAPGTLRFSEPVRVHRDEWAFPGCPHAGPSVAVGDDGRVHVAWYTGREGRQGLWYAASGDGGRSFGAPAALVTGEWVPPSQVGLAATRDRVWAVWDDRRQQPNTLALALLDASGAPVVLPAPPDPGKAPALAAAGPGALAAWLDGETVLVRRIGSPAAGGR